MRVYLKNNPAKFPPNLIWNDIAVGKRVAQLEQQDE